MAVKTVIRFCKNIRKFCNEINKCAGWIFFLCRVEFSKIGKLDITFIREMRVKGQIISKSFFFWPRILPKNEQKHVAY